MFTLEFRTNNEAFDGQPSFETCRILLEAVAQINSGLTEGVIFDINGNHIGDYSLKIDPHGNR